MTLSQVKEMLQSQALPFTECTFENEADFLHHISSFANTKNTNQNKFYGLMIHSNNEKTHITLEFEEKNNEYVFLDLWFGDVCFEIGIEDCAFLLDEIRNIATGKRTVISVTNPARKQWLSDTVFDRNDSDDDVFGEIGFQKAMKQIRRKKTFWEKLFGFNRCYEIYDWNTYECVTK